ncbi:hypothetical protein [Phyllobacterium sp. K27]
MAHLRFIVALMIMLLPKQVYSQVESNFPTAAEMNAKADDENIRWPTVAEVKAVARGIRGSFYDPYSIRDAEISKWLNNNTGRFICVRANAKNRMGAYSGKQYILAHVSIDGILSGMIQAGNDELRICEILPYRAFKEVAQ